MSRRTRLRSSDRGAPQRGGSAAAPRDGGAALVLTLFVTVLAMALGTTILTATVANLRSARLSQDAAAALDAAEAGLAQASAHLRTFGVGGLACAPDCASGYGSRANPTAVTLPGSAGSRYRVWLEPLAPLPDHNPGRYLVHATGFAGQGVRQIEAEVVIGTQPIGLPLAIFARSVNGGGNASVTRESILSTGCVYSRRHIRTEGIDVAFQIPAAVHSSQHVSENHATGNSDCGPSAQSVHRTGSCNTDYPWDHSVQGGPFSPGSTCATQTGSSRFYSAQDLDGDGTTDVAGSLIKDEASLRKLFGVPDRPFTDVQLDNLRAVARSQGTYFERASYTSSEIPSPATQPHTVLFFDLKDGEAGKVVDLKHISGWGPAADGSCPSRSLLVVVVGGNARLNGAQAMVANLVLPSPAPNGYVFKADGTANLVGTIYADTVDLSGTVNVSLDECFLRNLSPSLVDTTLTVTDYREVDRTDRVG